MGEQRESTSTKRSLAGEQSGGTLVSDRSHVALGLGMLYVYICIEHEGERVLQSIKIYIPCSCPIQSLNLG